MGESGFYMAYGYQQPHHFTDPELVEPMSTVTKNRQRKDQPNSANIDGKFFNSFRQPTSPLDHNGGPDVWDNMAVPAIQRLVTWR